MRYFIQIAYNGTNYHGWQIQPNNDTVQARINFVLSTILRENINCMGCGRTDAGVHASKFFLHFDTEKPLLKNMIFRMNKFLPKDIAVQNIIPVTSEQHSRFDATYRAYDYYIHFQKSPFLDNLSFYFKYGQKLNFEKMEEAFQFLQTIQDFAAFQKNSESKTSLCRIYKTDLIIDKEAQKMRIHIAANRFLRGMVRLIVGSLLVIGKEQITLETYKNHISAQKIIPYNRSAPACGLYLSDVRYPFI